MCLSLSPCRQTCLKLKVTKKNLGHSESAWAETLGELWMELLMAVILAFQQSMICLVSVSSLKLWCPTFSCQISVAKGRDWLEGMNGNALLKVPERIIFVIQQQPFSLLWHNYSTEVANHCIAHSSCSSHCLVMVIWETTLFAFSFILLV